MATLVAMSNIIRGLVFAGVGLGLGIALAILLTGITGEPLAEPAIALGYLLDGSLLSDPSFEFGFRNHSNRNVHSGVTNST